MSQTKRPRAKYRTKQDRLLACFRAYRDLVGRAVTLDEVSRWAIEHELYPTPDRCAKAGEALAWEQQLAAAIAKGLPASEARPAPPDAAGGQCGAQATDLGAEGRAESGERKADFRPRKSQSS